MNNLTQLERTHVKIIDDQHSEITELINRFFEFSEYTPDVFQKFKAELTKLVKKHFETEETLMTESKYENYYSHKQEHDRFLRKLSYFTPDNIDALFEFVRDWLNNHLQMKDLKLGRFLVQKSGRIV